MYNRTIYVNASVNKILKRHIIKQNVSMFSIVIIRPARTSSGFNSIHAPTMPVMSQPENKDPRWIALSCNLNIEFRSKILTVVYIIAFKRHLLGSQTRLKCVCWKLSYLNQRDDIYDQYQSFVHYVLIQHSSLTHKFSFVILVRGSPPLKKINHFKRYFDWLKKT